MKMYKMNDMSEFQFDENFVNEIKSVQKKDTPMIFLPILEPEIVIETTKGKMTLTYQNMALRDRDYNALNKIKGVEVINIIDL